MRNDRVDDAVILGCTLDFFFLSASFCPSLSSLQVIFRNLSTHRLFQGLSGRRVYLKLKPQETPPLLSQTASSLQPPAAQLSSGILHESQPHFGEDVKMWEQLDICSSHRLPRVGRQGSKARGQGMSSRRL